MHTEQYPYTTLYEPQTKLCFPLVAHIKSLPTCDYILTIPVFEECYDFLSQQLLTNTYFKNALLILVINQPTTIPYQASVKNEILFDQLITTYPLLWQSPCTSLNLLHNQHGINLLIVDAFTQSRTLPQKQGVGLARKIGADIACFLIDHCPTIKPWLFNTDADVYFPNDYFEHAQIQHIMSTNPTCSAMIYPYQHLTHTDTILNDAMRQYQHYLDAYLQGLKNAQSPYAWHALGSTLIISAKHYRQVSGFPKKNAGEDFHMLNKLSKCGQIVTLTEPILNIKTRLSDRVPFGTGPALNAIMNGQHKAPFSAQSFELLRLWLSSWTSIWQQLSTGKLLFLEAHITSPQAVTALQQLKTPAMIQHAYAQSKQLPTFIKHLHHSFDALKTLQFLRLIDGK